MNATAPDANTAGRELRLGEAISMDGDQRGTRLRCLAGEVWITQAGDRADHVVRAGREFEVTRRGRVVIEAMTALAVLAA